MKAKRVKEQNSQENYQSLSKRYIQAQKPAWMFIENLIFKIHEKYGSEGANEGYSCL